MGCVEGLIRRLWKTLNSIELNPAPFQVMPYETAMGTYGSDKPDLRLGMEVRFLQH